MAVSPGFCKADLCGGLAAHYCDLAILFVAGDGHALCPAGLSAGVAHADPGYRTRRRCVERRVGEGRRRVDRDRRARVIRDADVAPGVIPVVPGRERIDES